MEIHFNEVHTPPIPAATVVLLRSGQNGLEVLLQKRHQNLSVLGGAYVFPGGKIDTLDQAPELHAFLDQSAHHLQQQQSLLDLPEHMQIGAFMAAIRELWEESSILLGQTNSKLELKQQQAVIEVATAQLKNGQVFNELVQEHQIQLGTRFLQPWSRWITPKTPSVSSKRFDTLFFVAQMPDGQLATHDEQEVTQSVWLNPTKALEQYWAGEVELAPPQIMTLAELSHFNSPTEVLQKAREKTFAVVQPEPIDIEGARWLCYPGDPMHSRSQAVLMGPSRLGWRNKRFEPVDGFAGYFKKPFGL